MPSRSGSRGRRPRPAPEVAAPTAVQVSSSGSSEEGSDEEEEGSEGSGDGARSPGGSASKYKAAESEAEAEDPCLPSCPICMVVWTADGAHRVSCIPCGHVYGRHCLEMWLLQYGKKKAPCPQCGKRYTQNNIINLYVPEIVVPNNDLENQVLSLRERNEYLEKQQAKLLEEIKEHKNEFLVDGARVMGIDASSQIIFTSGRAHGVSAEHILTKVSMFHGHGMEKIHLPPGTKAIRDICVLPGGHVVFASLGRKLSIFSVATNNVVLQYDLPAPGWSCSGDYTTSSHIYAGLQNGMLLVFDIRQTSAPLHSSMGLSTHPVHTIHCAVDGSGSRKVFSASSIGPCVWDASENRPSLVSGMENQGVCISLACSSPSSDVLVASYRPRVELPDAIATSQASTPQSPAPTGSGKLGCHTLRRSSIPPPSNPFGQGTISAVVA
ncbi:Transposon protein [Zea mays]|uniref:RING-type E3 ubiquitin transferase n=2 Tax=Zea mays TaxID=4577 RepID=A0A1D6P960_MAIZE|nr:Transposon protein [Zea mays]